MSELLNFVAKIVNSDKFPRILRNFVLDYLTIYEETGVYTG